MKLKKIALALNAVFISCVLLAVNTAAFASATVVYNTSLDKTTVMVKSEQVSDHDAELLYNQLVTSSYYDEGEQVKSVDFYRNDGMHAFDVRCNFHQGTSNIVNCIVILYKTPGTVVDPAKHLASYVPKDVAEAARIAALFKASSEGDIFVSNDGNLRIPSVHAAVPFGIFFRGR